jgi:dTDP-4-dehydrorhamnose reductase
LLLTGASGFIGGALLPLLAPHFSRVVALGNSRPVVQRSLPNVECRQISLDDPKENDKAFLQSIHPDVVLHCAARANANQCEDDPTSANLDNVKATGNLLSFAGGARFFQVSTDLVFDGGVAPAEGFDETAEPVPLSAYGLSKRAAELLVTKRANSTVLRIALTYGEPHPGGGGFLHWMRRVLQEGNPLKLFTDEWRNPVSIADIKDAVLALRTVSERTLPDVVHVGGSTRHSRFELGRILCEVEGFRENLLVPVHQKEIVSKAPRPKDVTLNVSRLRQILGRDPLGFEEGLRRLSCGLNG